MRIAICDDDKSFLEMLHKSILAFTELPDNTNIEEFSSGDELVARYDTGVRFDIIFLDIHMPGRNGLETGDEIRRRDADAMIIFLTCCDQYAFDSFKIEAFDYLLKPVKENTIHEVLRRAFTKYRKQHYIVEITWQETRYLLNVNEIVYMEGYHDHVTFYMNRMDKDGSMVTYTCVSLLCDFAVKLAPYGFAQCHQSYIVNMNYIICTENREITLSVQNGKILVPIPVSTRRKKDFLRIFEQFLAMKSL